MKKVIITCSLVLAAFVVYKFSFSESPEEKVLAQLNRLTQEAVKPMSLKGVPKMAQIRSLRNFFTEDIAINAYEGRFLLTGRHELMKRLHLGYNYLKSFSLSLKDSHVELNDSQDEATVYLTALATGGGGDWNQAQELKMILRLVSGEWLIASAETVQTLSLESAPK